MKKVALLLTLLVFPFTVYAQGVNVIGGNQKAKDCFRNANMAANRASISDSMVEPCDYALEHVQLSPADMVATYTNRGVLLMWQGKQNEALASYEQALKINPQSGEIYVNRGNAWYLSGDYAMALDDYDQGLRLGIKEMHSLHFNMGLAYEKLKNYELAEQEYRNALNSKPDFSLADDRLEILQRVLAEQTTPRN